MLHLVVHIETTRLAITFGGRTHYDLLYGAVKVTQCNRTRLDDFFFCWSKFNGDLKHVNVGSFHSLQIH